MTAATDFFDMTTAPLRIGTVRLKVRDLDAVSTFYQTMLGLRPIESHGHRFTLGIGGTPLLELVGDPKLAPLDPRQAGLFHTAFLMPTRADLARWVAHVAEARVPLQGASDHIVSEALYLADPEGNGIEVYSDRPVSDWHGESGEIRMSTDPLDLQDLLQSAEGTEWSGFPEAGSVGHVHLQVGDTAEADRFYRDVLGLDIAARYPGASFYGSGGYHHQLAGNVWNSRRASTRPEGMAGLEAVEILVRDAMNITAIAVRADSAGIASTRNADGLTLRDPWGTAITLRN
ncbi:VOC family protein [Roseovarius sp. SCSIO 43702]|uniref:VOC family protein n=1 Tax=Roseovarius sp. SCSIO 43702 TaxID=2823043 RepID=UPI001C739597|nr:VOC family protein [Roseovarius sp. SCSIO 43702]QYX58125.1 VOC family protein [Roseovarius sp. SCSIO 43702]